MTRNPRTGQDPNPLIAPVQQPDPPLTDLGNPEFMSDEVDNPSKTALEKRAKAVAEAQVGEAYVVIYPTGVSLPVDPVSDEKDDKGQLAYPESVTLGDGRKVAVKDGHVVLPKGSRVSAGSHDELERLRALASMGLLSAG